MDNENMNNYGDIIENIPDNSNNNPNTMVSVNDVNADAIDPLSIFGESTVTDNNDNMPQETNNSFYEDNQSNLNKSINNHTDVVGSYNQSNNAIIDDGDRVSSYEEQLNNSQDINFYTQQQKNNNIPADNSMNYNNGYDNYNNGYNNNMNYSNGYDNYNNGYDNNMNYSNGYDNYNNGYDNNMNYNNGYDNYNNSYDNNMNYNYNDEFTNTAMYGSGNTVAYNNSGYSNYGNNFDSLNSGGYDNSQNFDVASSYAHPSSNNNFINFTMSTNNTSEVVPATGELISDGSKHPKTIGPEEFEKKMKSNNRPFNFMLLGIYGIIIVVIGYFAYNLWLDKNSFNFSKDKMNLVLSYNYEELVYVKGKVDDNENYEWQSDDTEIATVNSKGKITAKKEGTVDIKVTSKKTKKTKKISVKVINPEIKQFTIKPNEKVVYIGNTYTVVPLINGQSSLTINMEWTSSNPEVATVDQNGVVKPKSKGNTKITVTIPNTTHKATISIIVSEKK